MSHLPYVFGDKSSLLLEFLKAGAPSTLGSLDLGFVLVFPHILVLEEVSTFVLTSFASFPYVLHVGRLWLGFEACLIWFVLFMLIMVMLLMLMLDVVVIMLAVVLFICQEIEWLWVHVVWPRMMMKLMLFLLFIMLFLLWLWLLYVVVMILDTMVTI